MRAATTKFKTDLQDQLNQDILLNISPDRDEPVKKVIHGRHLVAVLAKRMGLCSILGPSSQGPESLEISIPDSARELASYLAQSYAPQVRSYAMAAVNSLLPIPEASTLLKAQEMIYNKGEGKNVAIIGHFPFVERMDNRFKNLWVFELNPLPGDLPSEAAPLYLPQADVVAMTATTLLNGTCAELLSLCKKKAFKIMLGPSTPFAPCLFDWGIDALAGCCVKDPILATSQIQDGLPFKKMKGVHSLVWVFEKN